MDPVGPRAYNRCMTVMRALLATLVVAGWLSNRIGNPPNTPPRRTEAVAPSRHAAELQQSFERVASSIKPAVVSIRVIRREAGPPLPGAWTKQPPRSLLRRRRAAPSVEYRVEGIGSGVIIDPRGFVLTNEHVVHGAEDIRVTIADPDSRTYLGRVVATDMRSDLAVLRIETRRAVVYANLGDSDAVRVGDWAIAIGNPFGLQQTVTVGVISALRQSFKIDNRLYSNFLQTDAAINRGNSGGPLVNIRGEVIGVNTAIFAPTGVYAGIGFAIPSNAAKSIMRQVRDGKPRERGGRR